MPRALVSTEQEAWAGEEEDDDGAISYSISEEVERLREERLSSELDSEYEERLRDLKPVPEVQPAALVALRSCGRAPLV